MLASHRHTSRVIGVFSVFALLLLATIESAGADKAGQVKTEAGAVGLPSPGVPAIDAKSQDSPVRMIAITGVCLDENQKPLAGAGVALIRKQRHPVMRCSRIAETRTDSEGRYRFANVVVPPPEEEVTGDYITVLTAPGRESKLVYVRSLDGDQEQSVALSAASPMRGRVTDPTGQPVAGAWVWTNIGEPLEGILSAKTDTNGQFLISDFAPYSDEWVQGLAPHLRPKGTETKLVISYHLRIRHPDFADQVMRFQTIPDKFDIKMEYGGTLTGRVIDAVTGKPASKAVVSIRPIPHRPDGRLAQLEADDAGRYRVTGLAAGDYSIWARTVDRTCLPLTPVSVVANKSQQAPDLPLVAGGWIKGRVLHQDGQPVTRDPQSGARLSVGVRGPARAGTDFSDSCAVEDDGSFRIRVPPGRNYPLIHPEGGQVWTRVWRKERYEQGIDVSEGETVKISFRVLKTLRPKPRPPRSDGGAVELAEPVPPERWGAQEIRELGGWYQLDAGGHVVEINMVYHETPEKVRYDNKYTESDEALQAASAFPQLKRLYLHKGQATDDAMANLVDLQELQTFFVWDAEKITDAGVENLAGLDNLESIHLTNGKLGDDSLKVFATLPRLRRLSLQGNAFTDTGLEYLADMEQLESLWIGLSKGEITDAGLKHLERLTNLKVLEVQKSGVTEKGVAKLKGMLPGLQ